MFQLAQPHKALFIWIGVALAVASISASAADEGPEAALVKAVQVACKNEDVSLFRTLVHPPDAPADQVSKMFRRLTRADRRRMRIVEPIDSIPMMNPEGTLTFTIAPTKELRASETPEDVPPGMTAITKQYIQPVGCSGGRCYLLTPVATRGETVEMGTGPSDHK